MRRAFGRGTREGCRWETFTRRVSSWAADVCDEGGRRVEKDKVAFDELKKDDEADPCLEPSRG